MLHTSALRRLFCLLLGLLLLAVPASAFVIGTTEDLEALHETSENSAPIPAQNAAPIATNLEFFTYKNVAITEQLAGFDPEGDLLQVRITKNPARGSVSLSEENGLLFSYTPYEGKSGKDSFDYVLEDTRGNVSAPATVKLRIQKARSKINYADMDGNPAHKAAIRLAELDVMVGARIGKTHFFGPEQSLSRAEFLALSMQVLDCDQLPDAQTTGFSDDASIAVWAKPYVAGALYGGSITGSSNEAGETVFSPDAPITRSEASVLLSRLMRLSNASKTVDTAPTWAAQSVANLASVGMISPDAALTEALTRADGALLLSDALDLLDFRKNARFPLL